MVKDWTKIQKEYKGLWVALAADEKTVMGSGKTLKSALEEAGRKGCEKPILTRMPMEIGTFVGVL